MEKAMNITASKLTACAALFCSLAAQAEFKDGNKLLADMTGNHSNQMYAMGYVSGVADTLMGIAFCPPGNVTVGQITDMTKQYLESYPAIRSNSADTIVARILSNAWPCAKKERGQNL